MSNASHTPISRFAPGDTVVVELQGGAVLATVLTEDHSVTHRLAEMGACYQVQVTDPRPSLAVSLGETFRVRAIWLTPAPLAS